MSGRFPRLPLFFMGPFRITERVQEGYETTAEEQLVICLKALQIKSERERHPTLLGRAQNYKEERNRGGRGAGSKSP